MKKYDLIVIGSGSANIVIDEALAKGKKCAMIEKGKFGGTCLTRGCIPTKVMVSVADYIRQSEHIKKIGLNIAEISVDFDTVSKRVWQKVETESNEVYKYYKKQPNLDIFEGTAKFVSNKEIKVTYNDKSKGEEVITGDIIVIGAGARTKVPDIDKIESVKFVTSETFFGQDFPKKPYKSLTVIGGGYIGLEFAHIFSAMGAKVNVVQRNQYILPKEERDISLRALEIFKSYGINIFTNKETTKIYEENGLKVLEFKDKTTGKVEKVESEEIIIAPGVMSNADLLGIENTDISLKNGYIRTNEFLETSVENVYAIGDINGVYQFRHKANYEAEVLSYNLFNVDNDNPDKGKREFVTYDAVPAVTYTYPQVAHVGITQQEAMEQNLSVKVAKHYYSQTAKGYSLGYETGDINDGFVKIIVDEKSGKILGAHAIGDEAAILIQPYVELMSSGVKKIKIMNEDITSELTNYYRNQKDYHLHREADNLETTNRAMVSHPSLAEVSMWTRYMDFK